MRLPCSVAIAALLCGCGAQSQPPTVEFGDDAVHIESGMYSDEVDYAQMRAVTLIDAWPANTRKTNGFNYKSFLRGSFALQDDTPARVYVDTASPPIIKVELDDSLLYLNDSDTAKTQTYYDELVKRTSAESEAVE